MRSTSDNYWFHDLPPLEVASTLSGEEEADVAIIGGGFTGIAAAYFIKQRLPEKRVIVLESEYVGYGSSGRNSGMACGILGNEVRSLRQLHGKDKTFQVSQFALQSLSLVEQLIEEYQIDCEYERVGRLLLAENKSGIKKLEKEARVCEEVGVAGEMLDREEARTRFGAINARAALFNSEEGVLNPVKYILGLKKAAESLGVEIYEKSPCINIEQGPVLTLHTSLGHVKAHNIVVATNAYSNPLGLFQHKVLPFYLYNIVTEPLSQGQMDEFKWRGRFGIFSSDYLAWMAHLTPDNRLLFINGNALYYYNVNRDYSHHPGEYQSYYQKMTTKFPFLKGIKISHAWGGRVGITFDGLPAIGCTGKHRNIFYSMGYYAHGLAFSHICGKMLADLIAGARTERTDHFLINRRILGVPSASATYLGANGYIKLLKMSDWWMNKGR